MPNIIIKRLFTKDIAIGRWVVHYKACLFACRRLGLCYSGDGYPYGVSLHPKLNCGDWNGPGCHTFLVPKDETGGYHEILAVMPTLEYGLDGIRSRFIKSKLNLFSTYARTTS